MIADNRILAGGCHCGAVDVEWRTQAPEALEVRACSCTFCSKHGARTATDPGGHVRFVEREPGTLVRYRFATRSADFLLCARCGVYLGAVLTHDGRSVATVNVNTLADRDAFPSARRVDYADEPRDARIARRLARWTPAEVVSAPGERRGRTDVPGRSS
jgi:hypothetical protein